MYHEVISSWCLEAPGPQLVGQGRIWIQGWEHKYILGAWLQGSQRHEGEKIPCLPLIKYSAMRHFKLSFTATWNKSSSMEKRRRKGKPHLLTNLIVLWRSSRDGWVYRWYLITCHCWMIQWTNLDADACSALSAQVECIFSNSTASFTYLGYESNLGLLPVYQLRRARHLSAEI
jgi:hypothetical protein